MCHARQKSCRTRTHISIKYARQTNINTGVNLITNLKDTTINRPENAFHYKHFSHDINSKISLLLTTR